MVRTDPPRSKPDPTTIRHEEEQPQGQPPSATATAAPPDQAPAGGSLTRSEQERLCARYLDFAIAFLRRRFGEEGEEVAGEALWRAVCEYDGRIPFRAFLKQRLTWAGHDAIRSACGREGSARAEANRRMLSLSAASGDEDGGDGENTRHAVPEPAARQQDTPDAAAAAGEDEGRRLLDVLRRIQNLPAPGRQVVLLRFLGSMNLEQISLILGHRRRRLAAALAEVRQSLPVC